nr:E3 ubiquitin-protein ligase SINAT2-like [Lepeophtheirus salmonis]
MDLWGQSVSLEELKSHLECPVCFNLCRAPPIYQCSAGHMLCSSCHDRVEFCPMCRLPLDSRRLLFAEKLLERLPQKCKFMNQGCDFEDFSSKVQIHEKRCVYAPIECKYTKFGCDVVLVKTAITHHENNCDFITTKCPIQNCTVSDVVMCRLSDHLDAFGLKHYDGSNVYGGC